MFNTPAWGGAPSRASPRTPVDLPLSLAGFPASGPRAACFLGRLQRSWLSRLETVSLAWTLPPSCAGGGRATAAQARARRGEVSGTTDHRRRRSVVDHACCDGLLETALLYDMSSQAPTSKLHCMTVVSKHMASQADRYPACRGCNMRSRGSGAVQMQHDAGTHDTPTFRAPPRAGKWPFSPAVRAGMQTMLGMGARCKAERVEMCIKPCGTLGKMMVTLQDGSARTVSAWTRDETGDELQRCQACDDDGSAREEKSPSTRGN